MNEFAFRPTHVAPQEGMPTWTAPDPSQPSARLDPLLPVQILEQQGDWSRIVCSNGWSAWVDGRLLISLPSEPREAGQPISRTADPRPAVADAERALARHRALLEDLAAGRLDLESFRRSSHGQRLGVVVDGDALWVFDAVHDRWCYCDGLQLQTYAATARPARARPDSGGAGAGAGAGAGGAPAVPGDSRDSGGGARPPIVYPPTQAGAP
ncbi:hypothetical protein [Kitasatospora sp. NPDC050543]|uniref:hypothetical protein n=1 Tax=Kitasatospora sp. NPDC050543 TaxID=3364054 RepID=UPI0037AB8105